MPAQTGVDKLALPEAHKLPQRWSEAQDQAYRAYDSQNLSLAQLISPLSLTISASARMTRGS
jgi:hypothetical protein